MPDKLEAHRHRSAEPDCVCILSERTGFAHYGVDSGVRIYVCPANAERQSANFIHAQNEVRIDADIAVAI